jgi:uncharacterized protein YegJ (DUF2314 family)
MSEDSPVTFHKDDDPEMEKASQEARKTFRHFWKEVSLDYNRIVPALEVSCIKLPFSDDESDPDSQVEHMWVSEIDFDGERIRGVLINAPNWLKSVKEGDAVECAVDDIGDWMCVLAGKVYGAYTVQVTRGRMSESERTAYDEAWGLEFPPPDEVLVPPDVSDFEPVIAKLLQDHLEKDIETVKSTDDAGRSPLHLEALYGRRHSVQVLLDYGADPTAKCDRGWTPRDYANSIGWAEVASILESAEAEQDGAGQPATRAESK